jgi:hypothetical protein
MIAEKKIKIIFLIMMLCSCKKMYDEKLIHLFEETKGVMEKEELLKFKSTHIDSLDLYNGNYRPLFYLTVEKNPSIESDVIAYLDSKGISKIEPIRYLYLCFSFHSYLNDTTLTDEEIFEKIKQVYKKRKGINLEGNMSNVIFPDGNYPETFGSGSK